MQNHPRISGLNKYLLYMADHPPGEDQYAKSFYRAVVELLESDPRLVKLFVEVFDGRQINDVHLANLILRATQARLMDRPDYPTGFDGETWKVAIGGILEKDWEGFLQDLLTKDTGTTVYRRSAGLKIIIGALFSGKKFSSGVKVLDIGSGRNYMLRGLVLQIPMGHIEGGNGRIQTWLGRPVKISKGIALDKVDYRIEEAKRWALSSGFRPGELRVLLPEVLELEEKFEMAEGVKFYAMDYRDLSNGGIKMSKMDIVIACTVLYQDPEGQHRLMQIAKELLKPDGVFIIQDFARRTSGNKPLTFRDDWATPFSYRTFITGSFNNWEWWDVLQWLDGRCKKVRRGEDFAKFEKLSIARGGV